MVKSTRKHKIVSGNVLVNYSSRAKVVNVGTLVVNGNTEGEQVAEKLRLASVSAYCRLLCGGIAHLKVFFRHLLAF